MKHRNLSARWKWYERPFPVFCTNFPPVTVPPFRQRRENALFPVSGVVPILNEEGFPELPEGRFVVEKTAAGINIRNGADETDRCLLFVGAEGYTLPDCASVIATTGISMANIRARSLSESSVQTAVILGRGEYVALSVCDHRGTSYVRMYTWDGCEVREDFSLKSAWDGGVDTAEVL